RSIVEKRTLDIALTPWLHDFDHIYFDVCSPLLARMFAAQHNTLSKLIFAASDDSSKNFDNMGVCNFRPLEVEEFGFFLKLTGFTTPPQISLGNNFRKYVEDIETVVWK